MGGAYKMGDVQCTHPRRTRGSSSNTPVKGVGKGVEGRFRKLGRSIRPRFEFTLVFSFLLSSHRASFLRIVSLFLLSPLRRLPPPPIYPYIYTSSSHTTSLAPTRPALSASSLISSLHHLTLCEHAASSDSGLAQLDAQSDRSSIVRDDTRKRNCV